ncbi:sugar kinase [Clostridia bacterium]|nr:sugar kinase [Clostridia bacterium]
MKKMIVAGNMGADYVKKIDSYPERGRLSSITDISRCVGGCACNTAVALARLDRNISVTSMGRVGGDENGRYICETLKRENIANSIIVDASLPTSFTDVMSESRGERTFFHARGANAAFTYDDIPFDRLDCDLFHIGYILLLDSMDAGDSEYGTVMARTLARIRSLGIKTSVDLVSENTDRFSRLVTPSLKHCDYCIVNEIEASLVTGLPLREASREDSIKQMLRKLLELGVHELAVIHAPEGGWALSKSGEYAYVPSLDLPDGRIKGHVGAGDAFCAGMLYGLSRGFGLSQSLETAAGAAACNLTEANSVDGLRDYQGTLEMINRWKK